MLMFLQTLFARYIGTQKILPNYKSSISLDIYQRDRR